MTTGQMHAPGLKRMKRRGGRIDLYWVASPEAVRAGFLPKTQRLFGDLENPGEAAEVAKRCMVLDAEQKEFLALGDKAPKIDDGSLRWLCEAFETDPDSPYRDKRVATQKFYSRYLKTIVQTVGGSEVSAITGRDVRRWHKSWAERHGERSAYGCIQTMRRVVGYGCELRNRDAMDLARVLENVTFSVPSGRKKRATYEQVSAFRAAAHEAGRPSLALAVTIQFELGLRQKDVIGEWTANRTSGIDGWAWGLTWAHIDGTMLTKPTSKSNGRETAEHDLSAYPDVLTELSHHHRGIGPLILDERSGKPWSASEFSRKFREIARKAGWPDDVWNMDSRAGAVSEAFEAGAAPADVMKAATHTQMTTTMGYNRGSVIQSNRVAEARQAKRKRQDSQG